MMAVAAVPASALMPAAGIAFLLLTLLCNRNRQQLNLHLPCSACCGVLSIGS
jgi:hypothetical protein